MNELDNHSNSSHKCSCGHEHTGECTHSHSHEKLYGSKNEIPAVFSRSVKLELDGDVKGEKFKESLFDWIEGIKKWALMNKYYIGHIKVFAESEGGYAIHLSTTGKTVDVKEYTPGDYIICSQITISVTAIILGAEEQTLSEFILSGLENRYK